MRAPNHNAGQPARLRFECNKISDAAFIQPATVINYENISALSVLHRLEENVDTAEVSRGESPTSHSALRNQPGNAGGSESNWQMQAQRSVCDEWCGKGREFISQLVIVRGYI